MRIDEEHRDLAPLRPKADPERWAQLKSAIVGSAAAELDRRSTSSSAASVFTMIAGSRRLTVPTAAALAAAAVLVFFVSASDTRAASGPGIAEEIGYTGAVAAWVVSGWTPSIEELLVTMTTERQ